MLEEKKRPVVKIVGICGSLRKGSYSMQALQLATQRASALGADVKILDLKEMTLPFCDGGSDYLDYPDVETLRAAVTDADALILATPEYHGSISGGKKKKQNNNRNKKT